MDVQPGDTFGLERNGQSQRLQVRGTLEIVVHCTVNCISFGHKSVIDRQGGTQF